MANLHVIIGEDDYLVSEAARRAAGGTDGLEIIDSALSSNAEQQLSDIREADASFSTPPFLEPRKATWWKNVCFLPQTGKGAPSGDVKAALEKLALKLASNPLPDNQRFVLSGPRMLATSVFAKTLKPAAEVVVFAAGKPWQAEKEAVVRAIDFAAEMGLSFARGTAEAFVARVGTDTRSIVSELGKLRDYLGPDGTEATAADVADISSSGTGVEPVPWNVTDAIGARRADLAVAAIGRFEGDSGFAVLMTTVIEKFLRQLLELKDAAAAGRMDEAAGDMKSGAVRKMQGFLGLWDIRELRAAWRRFAALREKAVSSAGAVDAMVVAEAVRAIRVRVPRARAG